jgi:hypothetical protein
MATGRQPHRRNIRGHQAGYSGKTRREITNADIKMGIVDPGIGRVARPVIKMTAQAAKPAAQAVSKAARPVLKTVASAAKAATAKNPKGGVGARKIKVVDHRGGPTTRTIEQGGRTFEMPTVRSLGGFNVPKGVTAKPGPKVKVGPKPTPRTASTGRRPAPSQPAPAAQRQRPTIKMNPTKKAPAQERPRLKTQMPDWL